MVYCHICHKSPAGLIPVVEDGPDHICPRCVQAQLRQLNMAVDALKGTTMMRAIEAVGLEYHVTSCKWFVIDPEDPNKPLPAKTLTEALLLWRDIHCKHAIEAAG